MGAATRRLRIAQVAPPVERVPPAAYGGTERVVDELTRQLVERGHDVALFASGDSDVPARLIPTVERALRPAGIESNAGAWFATTVKMVVEQASEFDVVHSHLEWWSIPLSRLLPIPTVASFHGRLDLPWADRLLRDAPDGMVAISRHQASTHPDVPWTIIHNGLTLDRAPFVEEPGDAFCFVGRVDAEKGIIEAIEIALRAGRRLRIAAKVGNLARQRDYYESVFRPALKRAGHSVEYLGELQPGERDQLFAESYATLMPGAWPEPFGLVSIESLACGTPVLARRVGALPEIIREGVDGYFGDDAVAMAFFADRLGALDRREIRERVIERFSAARMADRYEELYVRMIDAAAREDGGRERAPDAAEVEEALAVQLPSEVTEPADAELPEKVDDESPSGAASDSEIMLGGRAVAEAAQAAVDDLDTLETAAAAPEPVAEPDLVEGIAEAPEPVAEEPPETVAADEAPEAVEPVADEPDLVAGVLEEPEPVQAVSEEPPPVEAVAEEPASVEAVQEPVAEEPAAEEPEPVAAIAEEPEPVAEGPEPVAAVAEETEPEPVAAVAEEPEEPELVEAIGIAEEPEAAPIAANAEATSESDRVAARAEPLVAALEAAVVDVVVTEPEASRNGVTAPDEEEQAEPVGAAVAAQAASGADEAGSQEPARPAIAVGPGPAEVPPKPAAEHEAPARPAGPAPAKPAAKRPSRSISIFTRTWSVGSGKAAGSRRRDRS